MNSPIKVLSTFFFFLLWYIFFILAFGLGFYIMLHNDFNNATVTGKYISDAVANFSSLVLRIY